MNYIGLNIGHLVQKQNMSKDAFGQLFGLNRGAIGSYIKDDVVPKIEILQKISAKFNISIDDLVNTDISIAGDDPKSFFHGNLKEKDFGVPYWNLPVSAGKSIVELVGKAIPDGYIMGLPGAEMAENILPVMGTSMEPEIYNGALIGVRKMNRWDMLNTERIYLIITRDDRVIKRIEYDPDDNSILYCVSTNYPRFKIFVNEIIEIHWICFVYNPK
jgi:transcriptional regulator with XRE-family HTH domain